MILIYALLLLSSIANAMENEDYVALVKEYCNQPIHKMSDCAKDLASQNISIGSFLNDCCRYEADQIRQELEKEWPFLEKDWSFLDTSFDYFIRLCKQEVPRNQNDSEIIELFKENNVQTVPNKEYNAYIMVKLKNDPKWTLHPKHGAKQPQCCLDDYTYVVTLGNQFPKLTQDEQNTSYSIIRTKINYHTELKYSMLLGYLTLKTGQSSTKLMAHQLMKKYRNYLDQSVIRQVAQSKSRALALRNLYNLNRSLSQGKITNDTDNKTSCEARKVAALYESYTIAHQQPSKINTPSCPCRNNSLARKILRAMIKAIG